MALVQKKVKKAYLGNTLVWSASWQPWANTIAYYPLTSNANDATSNHNDMTADSLITFSSDWAYFPDNSPRTFAWLLEPNTVSISTSWPYTILWWQKTLWVLESDARWIDLRRSGERIYTAWSSDNQYFGIGGSGVSVSQTSGVWYLNIMTIDNGTITIYCNGGTAAGSGLLNSNRTFTTFRWGNEYNTAYKRCLYWYLKDIIIEDRIWTASEMDDYFDDKKWDYWY